MTGTAGNGRRRRGEPLRAAGHGAEGGHRRAGTPSGDDTTELPASAVAVTDPAADEGSVRAPASGLGAAAPSGPTSTDEVEAVAAAILADPEGAPPLPSPGGLTLAGRPWVPLAILFGLNAVDELDRTAFGVLTPQIRDHFDLSIAGITQLFSLVGIIALGLQVVVGFYADRFPRVRIALTGASVWAVFTLFTGLAPVVLVLVLARIGSAVGKMVNDPTHRSLLADYYPPEGRGTAYYLHTSANSFGIILAPLLAGGLAYLADWRLPFIVFTIPTALLVFFGVAKLREPVRGAFERAAAGGGADSVASEEAPPSFGEAWRAIHQVRSLRRVLFSLPFLSAAFTGFVVLLSQFYEDKFDLNELEVGLVFSLANVVQMVSLVLLIRATTRYMVTDPKRVFYLVAAAGPVTAFAYVATSLAGSLPVSVVFLTILAGSVAPLIGGIPAILSLVIPPRARALGFSVGSLYTIPGFVILGYVAELADSRSFTYAFVVLTPFLLIGTAIMVSGGSFVADDIARVRASALAQAESALARARGEAKLLVARGIDVHYGQTQVLFDVDIEIDDGEIVALLGTNGAGKSTFLNAVTGLIDPSAGAVVFDGRDITNLPANEATALGIVMVPGGKGVFPTMTVQDNMEMAAWLFDKEPERVEAAIEEVLDYFPILRERWHEKAGNMSGGEQQMLTLGQAFIAEPKLLAIDELSLGLAPVIIEQLLEIVREIHRRGTTVLLVEQSVNVAITLAERAIFMEKGEVRFDGPTRELLDRPDVLRAVFLQGAGAAVGGGGDDDRGPAVVLDREARAELLAREKVCLQTHGLSVTFGGIRAVDDVDLELRQSEILGLIGPNGAGKTTIMDLVSGFLTPSSGRVLLHGKDVTDMTPDLRAAAGLGRSFQDARLFPSLTVTETLAIALERHIETKDPLAAALASPATRASEALVTERVEELIELMNLQAFANKFVSELSTGSRRVVDLACSLAHEPSVLLLDEPSSGIAQRETEALGPVLIDIRDKTGAALLVIEHDMPLIQSVSDRLVALELGGVVTSGDPVDVINHPRVVEAYLGGTEEVINRSDGAADRVDRSGGGS